jgi:hypothetical protein
VGWRAVVHLIESGLSLDHFHPRDGRHKSGYWSQLCGELRPTYMIDAMMDLLKGQVLPFRCRSED